MFNKINQILISSLLLKKKNKQTKRQPTIKHSWKFCTFITKKSIKQYNHIYINNNTISTTHSHTGILLNA